MGDRGGPLLDVRIAELGQAVLEETIVERDGPWVYELDGGEHSVVVVVNTDEPNTVDVPDGAEQELDPFRMVVYDNGWPAYMGPNGETHMGGPDDEDRWIGLIEDAIREHGGEMVSEVGE